MKSTTKIFAPNAVIKLKIMSPAVFLTMHEFSSSCKEIVPRAYGLLFFWANKEKRNPDRKGKQKIPPALADLSPHPTRAGMGN
jgi:hypothetical protein